jgi:hypothetical protein
VRLYGDKRIAAATPRGGVSGAGRGRKSERSPPSQRCGADMEINVGNAYVDRERTVDQECSKRREHSRATSAASTRSTTMISGAIIRRSSVAEVIAFVPRDGFGLRAPDGYWVVRRSRAQSAVAEGPISWLSPATGHGHVESSRTTSSTSTSATCCSCSPSTRPRCDWPSAAP